MKKTFTLLGCLALFGMAQNPLQAQNVTTINYTNAGLNPNACNSLNVNPLPVIGNVTHVPVCGGITYKNNALQLGTLGGSLASTKEGTAYAVQYAFKKGHTYTIAIMAASTVGAGSPGPTVYASLLPTLPNPQQTLPAGCGTVTHNSWSAVQSALAFDVTSTNVNTYNIANITVPADMNVLTILAVGNRPGVRDTVRISRLSILDEVKLPLVPATVSRECGSAVPQSFRVDNPNGVAVTSYKWELGANNGWLYNNSPAPQTIITPPAVNVITLTPACNKSITNITVTFEVDGKTYTAGTATASSPVPSFSITGPPAVCTSESFTVNNNVLPCGLSVAWSVSPSSIVNITQANNVVTASKIFDDRFTLTATVSGGCLGATPAVVSRTFVAGLGVNATYTAGPYGPSIPTPMPTSPVPNFSAANYITYWGIVDASDLSNVNWSTTGDVPYSFNGGAGNSFMYTEMKSGRLVYVVLDADGYCGHIHKEYPFLSIITGASPALKVAPNPARGSLTISSETQANEETTNARTSKPATVSLLPRNVYAVKITDLSGKIIKRIENRSGATPLTISLSGIPSGYYLLSAFDGKTWTTKSIVVNE